MKAISNEYCGARWFRCDLHVHTPFDSTKKFGVDIKGAVESQKKGISKKIREIAFCFFDSCKAAKLDLIAITDHNTIDGYQAFHRYLEEWSNANDYFLKVLPGVELTAGAERPMHILLITESNTTIQCINEYLGTLWEGSPRFDKNGKPHSCCKSLIEVARITEDYFENANHPFLAIPAHINRDSGIESETRSEVPPIWEEQLKGTLREHIFSHKMWAGFQTCGNERGIPGLESLLWSWAAVFYYGKTLEKLPEPTQNKIKKRKYWPFIQGSDPSSFEHIGSRYTWLKTENLDIEGIRLALLDPESRLRNMKDGLPGRSYPFIRKVTIKNTDLFYDIEIPFNPSLNTIIGGRGTGKSTIIEYIRYALERTHKSDFSDLEDPEISRNVEKLLQTKTERDGGQTNGTLLPDHQIEAEIASLNKVYRVSKTENDTEVCDISDTSQEKVVPLDVRTLLAPRIISQKQISYIAKYPNAQRRELDALVGLEKLQDFRKKKRELEEKIERFQLSRKEMNERKERLPALITELQKKDDQISYIEEKGKQEVFNKFTVFKAEEAWLEEISIYADDFVKNIKENAEVIESLQDRLPSPPENRVSLPWIDEVFTKVNGVIQDSLNDILRITKRMGQVKDEIRKDKKQLWLPEYKSVRLEHEKLKKLFEEKGIDINQHEKLLQQRELLKKEIRELKRIDKDIEGVNEEIQEYRNELIELHKLRQAWRKGRAEKLETSDADIRIEVKEFGDCRDLIMRKEEWFSGTGLRDEDWQTLADYVFLEEQRIPERMDMLVSTLRMDIARSIRDSNFSEKSSAVAKILKDCGLKELSGHFFRALQRRERVRLDEMELFLPEDKVESKIRGVDGRFKPIIHGSLGQQSTAILSLILSSGDQPLIIDQPEEDLDNQYIYDVVVDMLRKRKFSRQIIISSHNANIPVNGDSELIVALGVEDGLGKILFKGSIDNPDVKDIVSLIMEGSEEAFRLRSERYGY
ncbi:MAG TPA: hypothetical protein ENI15_18780 [Spirochaetes bacterium]|nr:hypothetical protein [Spirochaetota bacterium]